jgi:hypothetical protein
MHRRTTLGSDRESRRREAPDCGGAGILNASLFMLLYSCFAGHASLLTSLQHEDINLLRAAVTENLTTSCRLSASGFRLPTSDFRLSTFDFRLSTFDFRFSTFDFRLSTSDFRLAAHAPLIIR